MIASIGSLISAVSGTVCGIFGKWLITKEENKKREHEKDLIKLEMERDKLNSDLRLKEIEAGIKIEESRLEGELLTQEAKGFNEAVVQTSKNILDRETLEIMLEGNFISKIISYIIIFNFHLIDVLRSSVRPLLTYTSFLCIAYLCYVLSGDFESYAKENKIILITLLIDAIIFLVTSSASYWFMDRSGARDFRKKH